MQRLAAIAMAGGLTLGLGLGLAMDKIGLTTDDGDMLLPGLLIGLGIALLVISRMRP